MPALSPPGSSDLNLFRVLDALARLVICATVFGSVAAWLWSL